MDNIKMYSGEVKVDSLNKISIDQFEEVPHNTNDILNFERFTSLSHAIMSGIASDYIYLFEEIFNEGYSGADNIEDITLGDIPSFIEVLKENKIRAENWSAFVYQLDKDEKDKKGIHEYCGKCERCLQWKEKADDV